MRDQDLLTMAAKAAGIDASMRHQRMHRRDAIGKWTPWNPLDNAADALRLAVDLQICIMYKTIPHALIVEAFTEMGSAMESLADVRHPAGFDQHAAVRRAIVRAASKIG